VRQPPEDSHLDCQTLQWTRWSKCGVSRALVEFLGHNPGQIPILSMQPPMQCVRRPPVTSRFAVVEARSRPKLVIPPPLSSLVLRATLHRRDAVTSTFSNARSDCPLVSRADFSTAYQLRPRLHRAGGAPMAAGDQRVRGWRAERVFACIGQHTHAICSALLNASGLCLRALA
jgi:hypothetical protein